MEGEEEEEFETLLGEILQAMESTTHLDALEPAAEHAPASNTMFLTQPQEEGMYMLQSNQTFESNPELEECSQCANRTVYTSIVDAQASSMGLQTAPKVFNDEKPTTRFVHNKAAAVDASLATAFANFRLEVVDHRQYETDSALHQRLESSLQTPLKISPTWTAEVSSLDPHNKSSRPSVTHATADGFVWDVPYNGAYAHAHCRCVGFEHGCKRGNPYTDGLHDVFGIPVMPSQPFKNDVPILWSPGGEHVANVSVDGKYGWQDNSEMVAYLQAQQLHKVKLLQEKRKEKAFDWVLAPCERYSQNSLGIEVSSGVSQWCLSRDQRDCYSRIGGAFCPISCGYPNEQRLVKPGADDFCMCTQGICSRGDNFSFLQGNPGRLTMDEVSLPHLSSRVPSSALYNGKAQVRILSRRDTRVTVPVSAALAGCCLNNNDTRETRGRTTALPMGLLGQENSAKSASGLHQIKDAKGPSLSSLAEIEGCILSVAKDQHGCRFLQRKFDEGAFEDLQKIFAEVLDHVADLMVDPFGNYLIQKLLEVCTDDQRLKLLNSITTKGGLVNVSLNMHGTRSVQKLIETLKSSQQVAIAIGSLRSGVVTLIKDLNGNHVIQRCLQHLSNEDNKFIFEAAAHNVVEIATHRHGCCVLQRCIDHSTGVSRQNLIREIAFNSLQLSQDSFGNYVVQYVLELDLPWAIREVVNHLVKNFAHLSMQKFSSNVVEKCLKLSEEESRACIVQELIHSSHLLQLLQGRYANYVMQSALLVSKGPLHARLVEAIRPHIPSIRNNPYGKRILSRRSLKRS